MGTATIDTINFGDYVGFDLGASMEMPFMMEDLNLRIDARIPIYPGKLDKKGTINYKYDFETKISDMIMPQEKPADTSTTTPDPTPAPAPADPATPEGDSAKPDFTPNITNLVDPYVINRPLKLNAYAVYEPMRFLILVGGGGVGIRRPFTDSFYAYPEYYFSATVSLLDILKATASTEYTDEMFKHQLTGVFNLRLFELDLGVSLQSGDFAESFQLAGLGANVAVTIGF